MKKNTGKTNPAETKTISEARPTENCGRQPAIDLNSAPKIVEARRPPEYPQKYELRPWTYNLPQEPVPADQIKEIYSADVIVIGAGTSGKAAALSAAEKGVSVIQIDRHTTFRWSGGQIAAVDSRLQKMAGIKLDVDQICLNLMRWGANFPDQRFYRLWAEKSGAVMDWIMDMTDAEGIKTLLYQWPRPAGFDPRKEYYPDFPVAHLHNEGFPHPLNHSLALKQLEKHALRRGVTIRYETRAMQLIRRQNGRVTSVIALDKAGNYVQFDARKAIIMCTGDYGNNPWMMSRYCPHGADIALERNIYMVRNEDLRIAPEPLNTGDGHQMVMRIGGVMQTSLHAPMAHANAGPVGNAPYLRVNSEGERYENEDITAQSIANSMSIQPGGIAWQIFDSKYPDELSGMGIGLGRFPEVNLTVRTNMEQVVQGDTLEELGRKLGLPLNSFLKTVERYNELARIRKDPDYGKMPERLTFINKPPYYAGPARRDFLVVLGGLNTNLKFQPLDVDRKVIPGLYLAGNLVGNRFAVDYPVMCAGLSHGLAYVSGQLCGQYAAAEE
ncbi:MAG TPA: FAD-dependent oxidoreductase [Dehalococcoidales bacterium]|nr:FAD-dependent oxidoreductase [Dehalococcoidales bacterium]